MQMGMWVCGHVDGHVNVDNCKEKKKEQKERKRETYCVVGLCVDALQ